MSYPTGPQSRPGEADHRLHDVELVAAYASEDPAIDGVSAAALVASCPECRSEFELQREVAGWMAAAPVVALSDAERSMLHDRVDRAVGRSNVVSLVDRKARRPPGQLLLRLGTAAAALAVIAGVGGLLDNVGGDGDGGAAFQTLASELGAESDQSTAAAAATTTTAATFAAASSERAVLAGGDAEAVKQETEELIAGSTANDAAGAPDESQAEATMIPPCSEQTEDRDVVLTAESSLDGEPIVIFIVAGDETADPGSLEALVFQIADCSPVDLG